MLLRPTWFTKYHAIALWYSVAEAANTCTTTTFTFSQEISNDPKQLAIIAFLSFGLEFMNAMSFYGRAMMTMGRIHSGLANEGNNNETGCFLAGIQGCSPRLFAILNSYYSRLLAQFVYLVFDTTKIYTNRYFTWCTIDKQLPLRGALHYCISINFFILQLFRLSNETYETLEIIAGAQQKPFHHLFMSCIAKTSLTREAMLSLGTIEHVLDESILTWMLWALEAGVDFKKLFSSMIGILLFIASTIILTPIVALLIFITYQFEAKHGRDNITGQHIEEVTEKEAHYHALHNAKTPLRFYHKIEQWLPIMAPIHGAQTCISFYLSATDIMRKKLHSPYTPAYMAITWSAAIFIGLGTTAGTYAGEVSETLDTLQKKFKPLRPIRWQENDRPSQVDPESQDSANLNNLNNP